MGTGTVDLLKAVTLNQDEPPFAWDLLLGDSPMNHPSKKQALLEAATELFAKDGFWQTTTASIAQEAGVATGTLFT